MCKTRTYYCSRLAINLRPAREKGRGPVEGPDVVKSRHESCKALLDANAARRRRVKEAARARAGEKESLTRRRDGRRGPFNLVRGGPTLEDGLLGSVKSTRTHTRRIALCALNTVCVRRHGRRLCGKCDVNAVLSLPAAPFRALPPPRPARPPTVRSTPGPRRGRRESLTPREARKFRVSAPPPSRV